MKAIFLKTADYPQLRHLDCGGICIVQGESGYRPLQRLDDAPDEAVWLLNERTEILNEVGLSAITGSMFGWDTPGAKLANEFFGPRREWADDMFPNHPELAALLQRLTGGKFGMGKP